MAQTYRLEDNYMFEGDVNFRGSISGFFMGAGRVTTGTAAPTTGLRAYRDVVWNSAPAAAAPIGWICVSRVDSTVKTLAAATAVNLDVATSAGMTAGDIVGVVTDILAGGVPTGIQETLWTTIDSVTDGDTIVLGAAIPTNRRASVGSAVWTMLWKALPSIAA